MTFPFWLAMAPLMLAEPLALVPIEQPASSATLHIVARGITKPPPIGLQIERPDGEVWRATWDDLTTDVPADMAGWHRGPGRYRFTAQVGPITKTFSQTLSRPVLSAELAFVWDGTPAPQGVVHADPDAASRHGHLHLRYIFLTTHQEPHRGVGIRLDGGDRHGDGLPWRVHNGGRVPIRGAGRDGRFAVSVERRQIEDGQTRWRPARTAFVCVSLAGGDVAGQRLEPGQSMAVVPQPYVKRHGPWQAGVHRIVFEYGLIPDHPAPRLDDPLPMVAVRTVHRRAHWFRLDALPTTTR